MIPHVLKLLLLFIPLQLLPSQLISEIFFVPQLQPPTTSENFHLGSLPFPVPVLLVLLAPAGFLPDIVGARAARPIVRCQSVGLGHRG